MPVALFLALPLLQYFCLELLFAHSHSQDSQFEQSLCKLPQD